MKQRGTQLLLVGGVILGLVALAAGFQWWLSIEKARSFEAGEIKERGKWQARESTALAAANAEIERLRARLDTAATEFNARIAKADEDYNRRLKNADSVNDTLARDLRAARVKLRDPGRTAASACPSSGSSPAAGPATAGGGDGTTGAELSGEAAEFLWSLAGEADAVAEQLRYAQDVVVAYYELCRK